jgi:cytidine deaminase
MSSELPEDLLQAALEVRQQAYAPFSEFLVGAALRTSSGETFRGCNVENRSYGLTNCAERVALGAAVAAGFREFDALVIATSGGVLPCGACRQVLVEFCQQLTIFLIDVDKDPQTTGFSQSVELAELLPGNPTL